MSDPDEKDNAGCDGNQEFPSTSPYQANSERSEKSKASPKKRTGGKTIGPYRLKRLLGEGGMGSVWLAEQTEPIKRQVAIKTIHRNRSHHKQIIARFEAERQALAMMDHRNIAKVLDAGISEEFGPYFVMEYCKGLHITKFCAKHKLNLDQRLKLFVQVCNAVQHAHQKGIIHRDLKPGNIIVVRQGNKVIPKVIDFGLVKAMEADLRLTDKTLFSQAGIGTYAYMSPEQVGANPQDVDTRADVYALGIILYELLTGSAPITAKELRKHALDEVYRIIREQDPPRPSIRLSNAGLSNDLDQSSIPGTWKSSLESELDWVVMKALQKDRESRYRTVETLSQDVNNYLSGNPVSARPPSSWYQFKKYISKHKSVAASIATISTILVTSLIAISWLAWQRSVALKTAESSTETARVALAKEREVNAENVMLLQQNEKEVEAKSRALADVTEERDRANIAEDELEEKVEELKEKTIVATDLATQKAALAEKLKIESELARKKELEAKELAKEKSQLAQNLSESNSEQAKLLNRACNLAIMKGRQAWIENEVQDAIAQFCHALRLNPTSLPAKRWLFHALESHATKGWHPPRQIIGGGIDDLAAVMSQDGQYIAVQKQNGKVHLFRHTQGRFEYERELSGIEGTLCQIYVSKNRSLFLYRDNTISSNMSVREKWVLAKETAIGLSAFGEYTFPVVYKCRFSEHGSYLIVTTDWSSNGGTDLIDTRSGKQLISKDDGQFFVSSDEQRLVAVQINGMSPPETSESNFPQPPSYEEADSDGNYHVSVTVRKLPGLEIDEINSTRPPMPDGWEPEAGSGYMADNDGNIQLKKTGPSKILGDRLNGVFLPHVRRRSARGNLVFSHENNVVNLDLGTGFYQSRNVEAFVDFLSPTGQPISHETGLKIGSSEFETGHVESLCADATASRYFASAPTRFGGFRLLQMPNYKSELFVYRPNLSGQSLSGSFVNQHELVAKFTDNSIGLWDVVVASDFVEWNDMGEKDLIWVDSRQTNGGLGVFFLKDEVLTKKADQAESSQPEHGANVHTNPPIPVDMELPTPTHLYIYQRFDPRAIKPVGPLFKIAATEQPKLNVSTNGIVVFEADKTIRAFQVQSGQLLLESELASLMGFDSAGRLLLRRRSVKQKGFLGKSTQRITESLQLVDASRSDEVKPIYSTTHAIFSAAITPGSGTVAILEGGISSGSLKILRAPDFNVRSIIEFDYVHGDFFPRVVNTGPNDKLYLLGLGRGFTGRFGSYAESILRTYNALTLEIESEVLGPQAVIGKQFVMATNASGTYQVLDVVTQKQKSMPISFGLNENTGWGPPKIYINQKAKCYAFGNIAKEYSRQIKETFCFRDLDDESPVTPEIWSSNRGKKPDATVQLPNGLRIFSDDSFFDIPLRRNLLGEAPVSTAVVEWAEAFAARSVSKEGYISEMKFSDRQNGLEIVLPDGPWQKLQEWIETPVPERSFYPLTPENLKTPALHGLPIPNDGSDT